MILPKLNQKYEHKRAIVTGANNGVGYEILLLLLSNQWSVLALDITTDKLESLNASHTNLSTQKIDVADREALNSTMQSFSKAHGGIDILFNNAGVGEGVRFKDYPLENWDWIIDINLKAVIAGCHFAFHEMKKNSHGLIVNMASAAGYANSPNMSPYNVTKAAVISLSESLAHEFSPYGIQVVCVMPTFFRSDIMSHSKGTSDVLASANRVVKEAKLDSRDAAIIILSQLHKNKGSLRFPFSAHAIFYGRRLLPKLFRWGVRKYLVK